MNIIIIWTEYYRILLSKIFIFEPVIHVLTNNYSLQADGIKDNNILLCPKGIIILELMIRGPRDKMFLIWPKQNI